MKLNQKERDEVKGVVLDLLTSLKADKLVLNWRKRQQRRAAVQVSIEDVFDRELPDPPFTDRHLRQKCELVYQHVYDSYFGEGRSIVLSAD